MRGVEPERRGGGLRTTGRALGAERERRRDAAGAAILERTRGVVEERLRQQQARARADSRQLGGAARRQEGDVGDAERGEEPAELVLHHVGQRADDEQRRVAGEPGISGTSEARQASSPWVKVVSMPLPE